MKSLFLHLLAVLCLCAPTLAQGPAVEFSTSPSSGEVLITVRAKNASIRQLMPVIVQQLSEATGREVELVGLDRLARDANVTVFLVERPWKDALRWITGSAGLAVVASSSRIQIQEEVADFPKPKELLLRSFLAHRQILTSYPESPRVPALLLKAGIIATELGPAFYTSAEESFNTIINDHSGTAQLWEAYYRLGGVYFAMGEWDRAALEFHEVADSAVSHGYHVQARKELTRALCEAGKDAVNPVVREDYGNKAVLTVEALDRFYPADSMAEQRERAILLGSALSLTDDPVRALRALDLAVTKSPAGGQDPQILAVRAVALARAGRHGDASTAWLAVGRQATGEAREQAFLSAAEEALEGDFSVAVMGIYALAEKDGFGSLLANANLEAKIRLGIADETEGYTLTQRLHRALEFHRRREHQLAVEAMRPLFVRRSEFKATDRQQLTLAFAKSLNAENLYRDAIEALRLQASETEYAADREKLYILAARIHEDHDNLPAAILALKGNL
jgi:tetratricopeptide (TPR) repeat protein